MRPLLDVQNLTIELTTRDGVAPVIDDLSFSLNAGETLSFVGESGCGKSMTALALMGLLPANVGRIAGGHILFEGEDLAQASDARLRKIRGNDISMIFQEPMTSQSGTDHRGANCRGSARSSRSIAQSCLDAGHRAFGRGAHSQPQGPRRRLPVSNVRWTKAKGDDRNGSGLRTKNFDCG